MVGDSVYDYIFNESNYKSSNDGILEQLSCSHECNILIEWFLIEVEWNLNEIWLSVNETWLSYEESRAAELFWMSLEIR